MNIKVGVRVTGHLTNRGTGPVHFTGIVTDAYRSGQQTMVAVHCDDGIERFALEENLTLIEPDPPAEPEWRTLKGVTTPFRVYCHRTGRGGLWLARDRKKVDGEPVEVVRLEMRGRCRYGYTEAGEQVDFVSVATKAWVVQ